MYTFIHMYVSYIKKVKNIFVNGKLIYKNYIKKNNLGLIKLLKNKIFE